MRELIPFLPLYKRHWPGLALGILLSFLTLASAIGLLTLSGWFIAASAVAGILSIANFNYMLPAAAVRGFSISRTAGRWGERVVSHDATFKLLADLRIFFFEKLTPLIPGNIANLRDADILNRLVADVDAMDHVYLRLLSPLLVSLFGIIAISGFLYWFDPLLGITLGSILLALVIIFPVLFYHLGKPHGKQITYQKSHLRIALLDWLSGQAELQIFGAAKRYQDKIDIAEQNLLHAQRKMAGISGIAGGALLAANGLTLLLMLWLAADGISNNALNSQITFDPLIALDPLIAMVAFATLASFELIMPLSNAFQYLSQTLSSAKRLNDIIKATPETQFDPQGYHASVKGRIDIDCVQYSYHGADQTALNQLSLSIQAGEKVALLGRTGCGKSTLLQLITRCWDPSKGEIRIDGVPLKNWQESALRAAISVVSQRVDIFNGALRNNLTLAKPSATDEELIDVLEKVDLSNLLEGAGLDAWLGDGGRQLSGGEKRRIGIARALLHDAPILLLDEPTEGLDVKTEQQILALLFEHSKNKTVLFITHRLVGLTEFDTVYLMDEGRIIEQGSHLELKTAEGRYADLLQQN